jgi:hypothetical protein
LLIESRNLIEVISMPRGNPNPSTRFAKGNTHAADNQNQANKRIRKSKLRKTLDKLYALEGKAMAGEVAT